MVFIQQFFAGFRLIFAGLVCLSFSYGAIADQTPELNEKLLNAISHNDLGEVQRFVDDGASPEASNASGLSAIDIAVDNGFYNIAHFLIAAHKKNLQTIQAPSNKQISNSVSLSIIDKISNFFKYESPEVPATTSVSALTVTPKASPVNTTDSQPNLFTKLSKLILDFLPAVSGDVPQPLHSVIRPRLVDTKAKGDEKVIYPVTDLTISSEDPYKIEKIVQTIVPPLVKIPDQANVSYVAKAKSVGASTLPKAVPRKIKQSDLVFGGRGRLGDLFKDTDLNTESCVFKSSWKSAFCIEAFNWPSEIHQVLGGFGGVVGKEYSIVHYLSGKSVQYHGLFPSQSFGTIASLLTSNFGAPTEAHKAITSMLAAAEFPNRVFRWVSSAIDDLPPLILEIREIDDLRWSLPPDPLNGVIRMYRRGEPSVFKILTAADLMLLKIRKSGQQN